jgi:hypothetical protein
MDDWTKHIHRIVKSLDDMENASSILAMRAESSATPEVYSWNLLHAINKAVQVEEITFLKSNILVAAFFLRHMLAGNLDLPQDISQIYKSLSEYVFHFH